MKWITRERPKIHRIACLWRVKRFAAVCVSWKIRREQAVTLKV
jgi:hypothetical protein